MTATLWPAVLAGLTPTEPVDLDDPGNPAGAPAAEASWPASDPATLMPSPRLYRPHGIDGRAALGIRVTRPLAEPVAAALHLASAAAERGVEPVILTPLPRTGLERFGFRVERLPDAEATEQARCEAELAAFWNLAIIIDADDLAHLG